MAFIDADRVGPLTGLDPRRRQLLSLGAIGLVAAGLVAGVAVGLRRLRRRH
jgi:hypothetical protein